MASISMLTLLVRDYDEAIAYYTRALGFTLIEDTKMSETKRWVVVGAVGGARLLLAKAKNAEEDARIGDQTGGRVFLFLDVEDFDDTYARMRALGVTFLETPRSEAYGKVAVFADLYGNKWDMVERRAN